MIIIVLYTAVFNINLQDYDAFPDLLLVLILSALCYQFIGYFWAIILPNYPVIGVVVVFASMQVLSGLQPPDWPLSELIRKFADCLTPARHALKHIMVLFYGFDRCSESEVSTLMYRYLLSDDDFDKSTHLLIIQLFLYFIISYISFKVRANWDSIQMKIIVIRNKIL